MAYKANPETSSWIYRTIVVACFIAFAAVVRIAASLELHSARCYVLFSGAKLGRSWKAFLFPLAALLCGDLFIGFYKLMPIVYFSFCLSVLIGIAFRHRQSFKPLSLATLLGAGQFFLITNFAVWALLGTYPHSFAGLITCYTAGVWFFGNTLASDAVYALVLFGGFALLERISPVLRLPASAGYRD